MATKGLSPTQRTLAAMRERGIRCAIVEKFNAYAGPYGQREDLFGIIDVLGLDPQHPGCLGIQCCGSDFSAHFKKITEEKYQETYDWLRCGNRLELWGWRKVKVQRGGKAMRWKPRVLEITLKTLEADHEMVSDEDD